MSALSRRRLAHIAMLAAALPLAAAAQTKAPKPVWPDEGPMKWTPRPTTTDISANDLRTRLYGIADDSMLGRRIGELGNYKTTDYIAREFKRLGLKPAGDSGTYFQTLAYGPSSFDTTRMQLIAGSPLALKRDWVPILPTAGFADHAELGGATTSSAW